VLDLTSGGNHFCHLLKLNKQELCTSTLGSSGCPSRADLIFVGIPAVIIASSECTLWKPMRRNDILRPNLKD